MRKLTDTEIEDLIRDDQIVWVTCRQPAMPLMQGKFARSPKALEDGSFQYAFCPYKRNISMPFLPADVWMISDEKSKDAQSSAIADVMKQFK
jgi:hypothetical protein